MLHLWVDAASFSFLFVGLFLSIPLVVQTVTLIASHSNLPLVDFSFDSLFLRFACVVGTIKSCDKKESLIPPFVKVNFERFLLADLLTFFFR